MPEFQAKAALFQAEVVGQVASLRSDDFNTFGYAPSLDFDAAESPIDHPPSDYRLAFGTATTGPFRTDFLNKATAPIDAAHPPLTTDQVLRRATAVSCAGCHQPAQFGLTSPGSLGGAVGQFPSSLGFVHENEVDTGGVHALSAALTTKFLPARLTFFVTHYNEDTCPCRLKLPRIPPIRRNRALLLQQRVIEQFADRINASRLELSRLSSSKQATRAQVAQARQQLAELEAAQETEILAQLRKAGLPQPNPKTDLKAQPMNVDVRSARGDPQKQRLLRDQAVLAAIKSEPPRRTVTGSFRVH